MKILTDHGVVDLDQDVTTMHFAELEAYASALNSVLLRVNDLNLRANRRLLDLLIGYRNDVESIRVLWASPPFTVPDFEAPE